MTSIAIVGSGPSAVYALQALLACRRPLAITVFESGDIAGVGTPYDPRQNSIAMLANIASIEIPPVCLPLIDYLSGCDDHALDAIGVTRDALGERAFFPRVALGAYFRDQLQALVSSAGERGHVVDVLTRHRVVDVIPTPGGIEIRFVAGGSHPRTLIADKLILATGHVVPGHRSVPTIESVAASKGDARDIGILGSSLSAIDVAVSVASARGRFDEGGYTRHPGSPPFTLTMMSRGGRLPEADFYCPLPAQPAEGFTESDVADLAARTPEGQVLDAVFERFTAILSEADPDYANRTGLADLTADSFPSAYFAERDGHAPFDWARLNLEEVERNHANGHVVPWRYGILRSHEPFAACVEALTAAELDRFNAGMKRVFADNYAAVPPLSIRRLLALHEASVLDVVKLDDGYAIEIDGVTGGAHIESGSSAFTFDAIVEARGLASAGEDEFPFPTLRLVLKANRDLDEDREGGGAVTVDADYRLTQGANPLRDIFCLSLPFLLDRKPFIQGLTSAADMGAAAAAAIIADVEGPDRSEGGQIGELIGMISATQPVMLPNRAMMLVPKAVTTADTRADGHH